MGCYRAEVSKLSVKVQIVNILDLQTTYNLCYKFLCFNLFACLFGFFCFCFCFDNTFKVLFFNNTFKVETIPGYGP